MPTEEELISRVHSADSLADLLEHLGWTDVLRPRMERYMRDIESLVVQAVLGGQIKDTSSGALVTKEQLAGQASGIRWLIGVIERIIREGGAASEALSTSIGYQVIQ